MKSLCIFAAVFLFKVLAHQDVVWQGGQVCPKGSRIAPGSNEQMYIVPKKVPEKIRSACVGDSITMGFGSIVDPNLKGAVKSQLNTNGAKFYDKGWYLGYPYKLWEILEDKNLTSSFEILNFGLSSRFASKPEDVPEKMKGNSYFETCDYH